MTDDTIHYSQLIDQSMRGVVRDVLKRVQLKGLPGNHHFYVSYLTTYPGVKMSEQLRAKYPREITIVMQHQFWDFKVEEQQFHVTMSFGGVPEKLTVPFAALTAFADPSVRFGLQFQPSELFEAEISGDEIAENAEKPAAPAAAASADESEGDEPKIISLDAFRKK